jgi:hypothetical protein
MEELKEIEKIKGFLNNRNSIFSDYVSGYDIINGESLEYIFNKTSIRFNINTNHNDSNIDEEEFINEILLNIMITLDEHKFYNYAYYDLHINYILFKHNPFLYFEELRKGINTLLDTFVELLELNKCELCEKSCLNFYEEGIIKYCYDCFKTEEKQIDCPICLISEQVSNSIKMPCCKTDIHVNCIKSWLIKNKSCPLCRNEYSNHPYLLDVLNI